jgi:hypothetical protein
MTTVQVPPSLFGDKERIFLQADGVQVSLFRYETGVAALRLANRGGYVIVLPFLGQMVWDASFAGVGLTMGSMFTAPRPASMIADTYGCYAFHSGLLRNGNPGPEDSHPPHGEMPCAPIDQSWLEVGNDAEGIFVRLVGEREYIRGFGAHYRARPSVTLRAGSTLFDIGMAVENLGGGAMDLMYMCHINPAFVEDGHIVQPAPWTPEAVAVRTAIPPHIPPSPAYLAQIEELARTPAAMEFLAPGLSFDPEQVFYIRGLRTDAAGLTHLLLRRPEGDGFAISYSVEQFSHTVRWLMRNADHKVAAFALPATCEPEGFSAERRKGNVRSLAPGATATFSVRTGYVDSAGAAALQRKIAAL